MLPIVDGLPSEEQITEVVHTFYSRVRQDELLAPVFARRIQPDDWPRHLATMVDFWSSILRTSGRYRGRPLAVHGQLGELPPHLWQRWLNLFTASAEQCCPPEIAELFVGRARQIAGHLSRQLATAHEASVLGQRAPEAQPV